MFTSAKSIIQKELDAIHEAGLHKAEHILSSRQGREAVVDGKKVLNFCANNHLCLGVDQYGFGLSSVRFICGTQDLHKELEKKTAEFLAMEDAILYSSCMTANIGLFASFLGDQDIILSDGLNHASIIDGIRASKAERYIFKHMDMQDLEKGLQESSGKRMKCIVTDGVFSMDGDVAPLSEICRLAEQYDAIVVVDDSHATGFMGEKGRGTHEYANVMDKVDLITSTYGKALGGANGGFIAGRKELIALLRERSRTYLFSNSLAPVIAATSLFAIQYVQDHPELRERLWENTRYFREKMKAAGFQVPQSEHPIVPVIIGDPHKTVAMAKNMFEQGVYVVAFSYPVVPQGTDRIRTQISAAHTKEDIDKAVDAFIASRDS
ncbi:MAG: glycine C-acetyltransferase [Candidatus Wildermuthbacteria bacterium]|nr:glycine C-acetyltransferase [Candidatus Wildermuthbacteria bacterium]